LLCSSLDGDCPRLGSPSVGLAVLSRPWIAKLGDWRLLVEINCGSCINLLARLSCTLINDRHVLFALFWDGREYISILMLKIVDPMAFDGLCGNLRHVILRRLVDSWRVSIRDLVTPFRIPHCKIRIAFLYFGLDPLSIDQQPRVMFFPILRRTVSLAAIEENQLITQFRVSNVRDHLARRAPAIS